MEIERQRDLREEAEHTLRMEILEAQRDKP